MLAYKYMSLEGLDACLTNRSIRFSKPINFNDPFDCAASAESTIEGFNVHPVGSTNADKLFMIRSGIGVLSLTRNPLNPLMWAHYGGNHTGGVVAIDTIEAGLECADLNIITASKGNVIYTTLRPSVDGDHLPYHDELNSEYDRLMLERLFLYKSMHWSYEEEIRVARRIDYTPQVRHEDFEIPASAIKSVYLGAKYLPALVDDHIGKLPRVHLQYSQYETYLCFQDRRTWDLHAERYAPMAAVPLAP